jgi:RimJ/RimL family protein N-acetyltransferase
MARWGREANVAAIIEFETERLRLRQWRDSDREPFAALNADARVMEFFPALLSRAESDAMADRCASLIAERGWGVWAVETKAAAQFIGMVGLHIPTAALPFSPCVEILWRLAAQHWGKGYATEAARGALLAGFDQIGLAEIVSFTTLTNLKSQAVMERLGMKREAAAFEHPSVAAGSPLRAHCLYRLSRNQWTP